jgi:hypothetical protein
MNTYYYTLLIVFSIIAYFIVIDNNVGVYFTLVLKLIKVNFQRLLWMIRLHPIWFDNPISKWRKEREYTKIIQELEKIYSTKMESKED